jgi:hypothetical protein
VRLVYAAAVVVLCGCDPQLAMSSGPTTRNVIEGCPDAVARLKACCPAYDSYLSCTYTSSAAFPSTDLSKGQSRCLIKKSCDQIEKAVTQERSLCEVSFRSQRCR